MKNLQMPRPRCVICKKEKRALSTKFKRPFRPVSEELSLIEPLFPYVIESDLLCYSCRDKAKTGRLTVDLVPKRGQKRKNQEILSLAKKDIFSVGVEEKWLDMIIEGSKKWKYFYRPFQEETGRQRHNRLILLRYLTEEKKSQAVPGAIILGPYDPNAPKDPKQGWAAEQWTYGYEIQTYIPFSHSRCFESVTGQGGPTIVENPNIIAKVRRAVRDFFLKLSE